MSTDLNALFSAMNRGDVFAITDQLFPRANVSSAIPTSEVAGTGRHSIRETGPEVLGGFPPADRGPATVGVLSEPTMGDNGFASFSRDVQDIEANMLHTQELMRQATAELQARQGLIEHYRRENAAHERLIGKLLTLLTDDDLDAARDLVKDEYDSIHGPRE